MILGGSVTGLDELRALLGRIEENATHLEVPLSAAGRLALKSAQDAIDAGGPGWPPNISGTPLLRRSGALYGSLQQGGAGNVFQISGNAITVGTDVHSSDGGPYPSWMQFGTGIFGDRGAPITPTTAAALVFTINGRKVVRRSVKGSPKRVFLTVTDSLATAIAKVFADYLVSDGQLVTA